MDTIDGMRTFAAVASQGSFTAGARQLGMTTKLCSKYIQKLEARLGAQLFNRTTRSVTLTDTGRAYLERCLPMLDQFDELEGLVQQRQSELAGPIRITAPTGFGSRELVQALQPFLRKHPKVTIDMHLSDNQVALVEDGFDLAIRFGALQESRLVARKLKSMPLVIVASPDYLACHGEPKHPSALHTHNCLIALSSADPFHWQFMLSGELCSYAVQGSFHANSPRAIAHMAAAGLGIGVCPHYAARPFLGNGTLTRLFEKHMASEITLYAVYPPGRHLTARIRALIDHLAPALRS